MCTDALPHWVQLNFSLNETSGKFKCKSFCLLNFRAILIICKTLFNDDTDESEASTHKLSFQIYFLNTVIFLARQKCVRLFFLFRFFIATKKSSPGQQHVYKVN